MQDLRPILSQLQQRGYEPQPDTPVNEDWFDRHFEDAVLRVVIDDDQVKFLALDGHMVLEWDVRLSLYVPLPLILAALDAAEREAEGPQDAPEDTVPLLVRRARNRAAESAEDAAECAGLGRYADARNLLDEAGHHLDTAEKREGMER